MVANPTISHRIRKTRAKLLHKKYVITETVKESSEDLEFLLNMIHNGKLKPIVDKIYSLDQASEAHRYVENGERKSGTVVLNLHD